ncbi:MAG: glycosyltransferase [Lachnospiraceae bacterium]|nr:glycosyltransferase [Lachnospiraceae bacterium]
MKIIQVIPTFGIGGAETMCENLSYELIKMEHRVTVISLYNFHSSITERMENAGIDIIYLDKKPGMDISMIIKLKKIFRKIQPDVIHTHLDCIKYAVFAAKLANVKRCVHTVHNVAAKEADGLARMINNFYYKHHWAVPVALSPIIQKTIQNVYGITLNKIPVIYNGIDLSRCIPKKDYSIGDKIILLHIGRFSEQKNHKGLLEAFQKIHSEYPMCILQLIGSGEKETEIRGYIESMGLSKYVQMLGEQSNVFTFLHDADIFLLPSNYEGMPMTIIEAMGTGVPIVATLVGGISDMLTDGINANLIKCDAELIYKACKKLIDDMELRKKYGKSALDESKKFSAYFMAEQYCAIYGDADDN